MWSAPRIHLYVVVMRARGFAALGHSGARCAPWVIARFARWVIARFARWVIARFARWVIGRALRALGHRAASPRWIRGQGSWVF
jgi:hypothetical protein